MDFTRNLTTENMFRDYLGVHPNHFRGDNESHSTQHTQKTKGGSSIVDLDSSVGTHRGNNSPKRTVMASSPKRKVVSSLQSSNSRSTSSSRQKQQSRTTTSTPARSQSTFSPPRQHQQQQYQQYQQYQQQQKRSRRSTSAPQHERLKKQPSHSPMRRMGSTIGASTLKFIGCFDGVCVQVGDWWEDKCTNTAYGGDQYDERGKRRKRSGKTRGRSRTSRPTDVIQDNDDDDTLNTYSDGSATEDSYSFDDQTYDSYDDQFLARDHRRRSRSREQQNTNNKQTIMVLPGDDEDSLNSYERQRRWKEAKRQKQLEDRKDFLEGESAVARQRRELMEQERIAIELQRQQFHEGSLGSGGSNNTNNRAMSAVSSGKRSATVSTARTEVIHNTLRSKRLMQNQDYDDNNNTGYENVNGGATTEWPSEQQEQKQLELEREPLVNSKPVLTRETSNAESSHGDEAQRAFDWIHDPKQREEVWVKATDSQSIGSRSVRSPKSNDDSSSMRSIPFDQAQQNQQEQGSLQSKQQGSQQGSSLQSNQSNQSNHHWSSQKSTRSSSRSSRSPPRKSTIETPSDHMPSQHWKKLDDKVQAERMELQAKHQLESNALHSKKQEQDELLKQRLKMFGSPARGQHSMNLDLSAIPTDGSEHAHQTHVLQNEQQHEVEQKEHELEILQGAIHKRLALSPSTQERKWKRQEIKKELASQKSIQEKEAEWLAAFKKRQAEIQMQDDLTKKQLDDTIEASNSLRARLLDEDSSSLKSHESSVSSKKKKTPPSALTTSVNHTTTRRVLFASAANQGEEDGVPPLPPSLDAANAPPTKSPQDHKQQITSSFDSDDQQSLEPNPRLKPIHCKVEMPTAPVIDEEKTKRLADQKRMRDEFKASRLAALGGSSSKLLGEDATTSSSPSSSNNKTDPVQALVQDGEDAAKSKSSKDSVKSSQDSHPSMLQENEVTLGSQSFSNMDDISVLTPASTKTMETAQTTQTTKTAQTSASKKSAATMPSIAGSRSSSKASNRTPVLPPSISELQGGKKRGESARLSAKRKELEWMWNAAKKPLEQLEEEQRLKHKKIKKFSNIASPGGLEESSVGSGSTNGSSKKRVVEYGPGVTPVDHMPAKVWTKKKGGSVTTATTASSTSSEGAENRTNLLLDKPPPKNRVSQLVKKQRELSERHRRKNLLRDGRRSPSVSVVPEEHSVATREAMSVSSLEKQQQLQPDVSFVTQTTPIEEMNVVTPEKDTTTPSPVGTRFVASPSASVVITPDKQKKSPSRVMNFWEQKEQEQLAKKAQVERQQKRESWNQKWSSPSSSKSLEPEKPVSKIELKRRELAAKRQAFQKHKEDAAKRLDQELGVPGSECNLNDSREEEQKSVDTMELVGKFEELKVVLNSPPKSAKEVQPPLNAAAFRRQPPAHRCLAERKQKELDRRNQEYLHSLSLVGRSTSHDTNSSTAWPDMEPPHRNPLQARPRFVEEEDAQSNESTPEKEITRNQQLRQAWRQRAWQTIDNKVDGDGFPTTALTSEHLGAKAVQKVLGKTNRLSILTEQY
ncbi:MAG: hypothetical protein SGBAC_004101 [Bacillariaceae sp.]